MVHVYSVYLVSQFTNQMQVVVVVHVINHISETISQSYNMHPIGQLTADSNDSTKLFLQCPWHRKKMS